MTKVEKIAFSVVVALLLALTAYIVYDGTRGFHTEYYDGHEFLFYGNKPFEHKLDCKKCLDKFD